jgi:hypothetical protein
MQLLKAAIKKKLQIGVDSLETRSKARLLRVRRNFNRSENVLPWWKCDGWKHVIVKTCGIRNLSWCDLVGLKLSTLCGVLSYHWSHSHTYPRIILTENPRFHFSWLINKHGAVSKWNNYCNYFFQFFLRYFFLNSTYRSLSIKEQYKPPFPK